MNSIHNIGMLAHVDAGKTTTTEHLLFHSGKLKALGRVDDGTAHTDSLSVERMRGISVRSAVTTLPWSGGVINLFDTPGHVDFAGEVERALCVLDGAVLVICAVDGVQAHTETLWRSLRAMDIPTLLYINKMDREGIRFEALMDDLRHALNRSVVPIQMVDGTGAAFSGVIDIFNGHGGVEREERLRDCQSALAEHDEALFDAYVNDELLAPNELKAALIAQTQKSMAFPVLFGASLRGVGIAELLDAMTTYLPTASQTFDDPLSALVYKVEMDEVHGRMAHVRLFSGTIENRSTVLNATQSVEEKVTQMREIDVDKTRATSVLRAGNVGAVLGLHSARVGDILGSGSGMKAAPSLSVPLLTVQVEPVRAEDESRLVEAMQVLDLEDPTLGVEWIPDVRELHIRVLGRIQLEVLSQILLERYGLEVNFGAPTVIYRETPVNLAEGFVAYTMPKPCWAILRFVIEPGPRGSGLTYTANVRTEDLLQRYQNEVERRVPEALKQGLYGWEVTDLRVSLVEGQHHVWHTHPLDFVVATPMAIMDGLRNAGTRLLEPILEFRLSAPEAFSGRILSDLSLLRAEFGPISTSAERFVVEGTVPLSTTIDYAVDLAMLTGGRAVFTTRLLEYREAPTDVRASRTRRGVNPLDTSQYILWARNALREA